MEIKEAGIKTIGDQVMGLVGDYQKEIEDAYDPDGGISISFKTTIKPDGRIDSAKTSIAFVTGRVKDETDPTALNDKQLPLPFDTEMPPTQYLASKKSTGAEEDPTGNVIKTEVWYDPDKDGDAGVN